MITIPTLLVLGAGASYPYGFPTADELKNLICVTFSRPREAPDEILAPKFFEFREAFLRSGQSSVDAFLERRPGFLDVGKLAIAYCLIPYENESNLYFSSKGDPPFRGGNWYQYLSGKLLDTPFERFGENKLSIITFNYDRSLEHYLFNALQNSYGKPFGKCAEMLGRIPIIHVYGQLGKQPYPKSECRPYRPDRSPFAAVVQAAEGITLVHKLKRKLDEAHALLAVAERICFLGFSYHELNLSRLAIDTRNIESKVIFGTAFGMIGEELSDIKTRVHQALGSQITLSNADNLQVLRENLVLR